MLVLEYCSLGSMDQYLKRHAQQQLEIENGNDYDEIDNSKDPFGALEASKLLAFAAQVASGLGFLAENQIVHRDVAARNVLVSVSRCLRSRAV